MKKAVLIFVALVIAAAQLRAQTDLLAQIHFAGADRISADASHSSFTNEFCSAEARALRAQTAEKLANFLDGWLRQKLSVTAPAAGAKLRPLLDDLQTSEWFLDSREGPDGKSLVALAVKLDDARAKIWQQALQPYFAASPAKIEMSSNGGWFWINYGNGPAKIKDDLARQLTRPDKAWFSADLNWPRLAQFLPALKEFDFPKFQMQVAGIGRKFQITGKLMLAQPLPSLDKWQIPTNMIHQPLATFTAARGVAPWLARQPWMRPLLLQPQPNQLFIWAMSQVPSQTFAAEPVPDASAALAQVYRHLTANTNWQKQFANPPEVLMAGDGISFRGLPPFVTPFIQPVHEPAGDFLFGGFFPDFGRRAPLSPELLAQLNPANLVYYHWEDTGERVKELPQFSQLMLVVLWREQVNYQSVAGKWLAGLIPTLGVSETEVTRTGPDELTFQRTSPGGFNAIEWLALVDWLEAPKFPAFDLRLPPPRVRPGFPPANRPGQPARMFSRPPGAFPPFVPPPAIAPPPK